MKVTSFSSFYITIIFLGQKFLGFIFLREKKKGFKTVFRLTFCESQSNLKKSKLLKILCFEVDYTF